MYKKVKDSNNRSGRGRKSCKFFDDLDAVLGSRPAMQPPTVVDSLDRNEDGNSDDGDGDLERDDDVMDKAGDDTESDNSATDAPENDSASANDSFKEVGETEGESAQPPAKKRKVMKKKVTTAEKVMTSMMEAFL